MRTTPTTWLECITRAFWTSSSRLNDRPCGGNLTYETAMFNLNTLAANRKCPTVAIAAGKTIAALADRAPCDVSVA